MYMHATSVAWAASQLCAHLAIGQQEGLAVIEGQQERMAGRISGYIKVKDHNIDWGTPMPDAKMNMPHLPSY